MRGTIQDIDFFLVDAILLANVFPRVEWSLVGLLTATVFARPTHSIRSCRIAVRLGSNVDLFRVKKKGKNKNSQIRNGGLFSVQDR